MFATNLWEVTATGRTVLEEIPSVHTLQTCPFTLSCSKTVQNNNDNHEGLSLDKLRSLHWLLSILTITKYLESSKKMPIISPGFILCHIYNCDRPLVANIFDNILHLRETNNVLQSWTDLMVFPYVVVSLFYWLFGFD